VKQIRTLDLEDSGNTLGLSNWNFFRISANNSHYLIATWLCLVHPRFFVGSVLFIFIVFCFVLCLSLYCVLPTKCWQYLWIVHSWLLLRFSLTFIESFLILEAWRQMIITLCYHILRHYIYTADSRKHKATIVTFVSCSLVNYILYISKLFEILWATY
jgi:hypothetical protein